MERQTVSIMKACEMVGVSRRTIYNWIAAGKVEYIRTAGGSIRIFTDTLWRQPDGYRADVESLAGTVASTNLRTFLAIKGDTRRPFLPPSPHDQRSYRPSRTVIVPPNH